MYYVYVGKSLTSEEIHVEIFRVNSECQQISNGSLKKVCTQTHTQGKSNKCNKM